MDLATEQAVRVRAKYRCEYCRFPEAFAEVPFQHDHIIAKQHGGQTKLENLALACCLRLNRADALAVRALLMREGTYPAD